MMAYVKNNPINSIDPYGKDGFSATLGGVSFVAGMVSLYKPARMIAGAVGYTAALLAGAYGTNQAINDGKLTLNTGKDIGLAVLDIAVLATSEKFPISSALLNTFVRPADVSSTIVDIATSASSGCKNP